METKAKINSEVRVKKWKNYEQLDMLKDEIKKRIEAEYCSEIKALEVENRLLYAQEVVFKNIAKSVLKNLKPDTQIKVITQTGKNQSVLVEHVGTIEKPYDGGSYFNMIDDGYNGGKPFTIGFSCLQLIQIL